MPATKGGGRPRNLPVDPEDFRLPLGEHLEELRQRLIRIVIFLAVGSVAGWFLQPVVYGHLSALARDLMPSDVPYREAFRNVTEPFMLKLKLSVFIGLVMVFPFCVLQLWGFVAPGLKPSERKPFRVVAPVSVALFALGAFFCYQILPSAFGWFVSYLGEFPDVEIIQEPGTLVFFIMKMALAFGIAFQLPLVVFFLAKVGVLAPATVSSYWRHATVVIFLGSGFLTPSADIFSMLMMAVPMTALFFGTILAVKITSRGRRPPELDALD